MAKISKLAAALALTFAVFALDLMLPSGFAAGGLYILPLALLLALRRAEPWHVHGIALLAMVLTLIDVRLGAPGAGLAVTLVNRVVTIGAVWVVALLIVVERRRTQQLVDARAHGATLFEAALEAAPDAMMVVDRAGVIRAVNEAATRLFRFERNQLVGQPLAVIVPERFRSTHAKQLDGFFAEAKHPATGHIRPIVGLRKDGVELALESTLSYFQQGDERLCISANRDVTEQRKLEERLRSSQRMEAIGRLAGGVAHDFNNLLAVIISYSKLARDALVPGNTVRDDIDEVLGAADRAAGLTRQLLAFSRRQVIAPRRLHAGEVVTEMDKLLRRLIGENIELLTVRAPDEGLVEIDPSQLEQVLLNLVVNARDAMPNGGRLTLEVANATLDEEYCNTHPDVLPGDYVMVAVCDTGVGMTEDVRVRIFEPFFTTKEAAAGTGLGLATVYGVIKQSKGHIWVYSEPGQGTTFKAYFPRVAGIADERVVERPASAIGGTETVLLVEDEAALRRVAVRVLRNAGYNVLEAANGLDALRKAEVGVKIDLLVTDVVMPMMGGRELATKLKERDPSLRVLYVSGYTENAIVHHGVLDAGIVFLQKPFQPDELLRRIRQVLAG